VTIHHAVHHITQAAQTLGSIIGQCTGNIRSANDITPNRATG
jgi:hypothetical protein